MLTLYKKAHETYKNDTLIQDIIDEKIIIINNWPNYTFIKIILRFKIKIVIEA